MEECRVNIFRTSDDPVECAVSLADQHICKMPVETAQMLATALRERGVDVDGLYRSTHRLHPCTRWAGASRASALWLLSHGFALCDEYEARFGREHGSRGQLRLIAKLLHAIPDEPQQPPPICVPDHLRAQPVHEAYRLTLVEKHRAWSVAGRPARWRGEVEPA